MDQSWTQQFLNRLSLPDETLPGQTLIEILGNKRVLIEHHKGVAEYSQDRILVRIKQGFLCICGRDLHLCRMVHTQLIICGHICSIKFEEENTR